MSRSLFNVLRLKLLSSEIYHSKAKSQNDVTILDFTKATLRKVMKL